MLEFMRIFGFLLALTGFALAVFVFFRFRVASAIMYFTGSENRRLKEYQKIQKEYQKNSSKHSPAMKKNNDSTGTLNELSAASASATVVDIGDAPENATMVDDDFVNALFYAQSTTTLLEDNRIN